MISSDEMQGKAQDVLGELFNKINEMVGGSPIADIEKNVYALIQGALTKMELVSRDEFDVQAEVLRNTREKLVELEKKLAELEALQKSK